ncbi:MAG: Ni/Fe hydrogenase subunit alpha [Candidatus Diapherotrites archaeon]|nr:Ni/Fe hydrogenase subunit alpha [Candidatus Diapherotrites archaeon]
MHNLEIDLKNITKIEGHAHLYVKVEDGQVRDVKFKISENKRFFEKIVRGKHIKEAPLLVSRICGFCSASHLITTVEAIEHAYNLELSEQTVALRNLFINGEVIKSHILHLYFLALPDYLKKESILEFDENEHEYIHTALRIKDLGSKMLNVFGGRSHHSINVYAGGFKYLPKAEDLEDIKKTCEELKKDAYETIRLFNSFKESFERPKDFVALTNNDYNFLEGKITSMSGICINENEFLKYVSEFVVPYSMAKYARFGGKEYMVGSLSRIKLNKDSLTKDTKKIIDDLKLDFSKNNMFLNNLAQAIEIYHCIDHTIEIINNLKIRKENLPKLKKVKNRECVGVSEAPRGTLFHGYELTPEGKIKSCNIIVPTAQNAVTIEKDIKEFIQTNIQLEKTKLELEIEKLIRAYDPCISCATHFLKVRWLK